MKVWPAGQTPLAQNDLELEEGVGVTLPKLPALKNFQIFSVEFFDPRKLFDLTSFYTTTFFLAGFHCLLEPVELEQMSGWDLCP